MKHLSADDLQTLYQRRVLLNQVIQTVALQAQGNADDSWKRELGRMNAIRQEIGAIVEDPKFDVLVPKPEVAHPRPNTYSPIGTLVNVVTTGRELITYLDGILQLHVPSKLTASDPEAAPVSTDHVFIGHGRNELVRHRVKSFVADRCHLQPVILEELPSQGMTVIEKLEKYGRATNYAVLILAGDDFDVDGAARARQNVIQELGWFQGVLGRNRTTVLMQRGVEVPSNIAGVVYIEFVGDGVDSAFDRLRAEFEAAGLLEPAS
jgi:hypothetical protein